MSTFYKNCWSHFKKNSNNKDLATCDLCNKTLSCKGSATIGLRRHLEGVHGYKREESNVEPNSSCSRQQVKRRFEGPSSSSDQTILMFIKRPTVAELISKLAAVDGFSFNKITKSEFIRQSMTARGFNLPRNPTEVRQLMMEFYYCKKEELVQTIRKLKDEEKKFSVSIDEWTSTKNKRYMDIHIYRNPKDSFNLGLVPINGSCSAEKTLELLTQKFDDFGISLEKDIVSVISDGAAVMQKFGRLSPAHQQLCYNHGLHLAILKTFYIEKKKESNEFEEDNSDSGDEDCFSEYESDFEFEPVRNRELQMQNVIEDTIIGIRKIVKIFKNSPVKNSVLQKYVQEYEQKELSLLLDCKTRWNTMETMIKRFLRIKKPVKMALSELNMDTMWREDYVNMAETLLIMLEPVRITVECLSREDSTLLTAEGALKFLFSKLEKVSNELSKKLLIAIKEEISKRRNNNIISLYKFLQNPTCEEKDTFFRLVSKNEIYKIAKEMLNRLFASCQQIDTDEEDVNEVPINGNEELSLQEQINLSITDSVREVKPGVTEKYQTIKQEFHIFQTTGKRTTNLEVLREALSTMKPTSTQNERNFSIANDFVTKKRNRLSNTTLDALCFLKNYFKVKE